MIGIREGIAGKQRLGVRKLVIELPENEVLAAGSLRSGLVGRGPIAEIPPFAAGQRAKYGCIAGATPMNCSVPLAAGRKPCRAASLGHDLWTPARTGPRAGPRSSQRRSSQFGQIGPPRLPPKLLRVNGFFSSGEEVLGHPGRRRGRTRISDPRISFVPLLVTVMMAPPAFFPYSGLYSFSQNAELAGCPSTPRLTPAGYSPGCPWAPCAPPIWVPS